MAVVFVMPQDEGDAGANPVRIRILNAQFLGQTVRGREGRADSVDGQQIGILLQQFQRVFTEEAVQAYRVFRCDPGSAQQKNQLFQTDLASEFLCILLCLVQADAADFGQSKWLLFQNAP